MTNTTYTLQLVPKGYKVVPEECVDLLNAVAHIGVDFGHGPFELNEEHVKLARDILSSTPLNTPPVLRWEDGDLRIFGVLLASMACSNGKHFWQAIRSSSFGEEDTEQEARRAAEKALGFTDGLIIEEA